MRLCGRRLVCGGASSLITRIASLSTILAARAAGGIRNTIAGQAANDSDMALLLARMPANQGRYDHEDEGARKTYIFWLGSDGIYSHP